MTPGKLLKWFRESLNEFIMMDKKHNLKCRAGDLFQEFKYAGTGWDCPGDAGNRCNNLSPAELRKWQMSSVTSALGYFIWVLSKSAIFLKVLTPSQKSGAVIALLIVPSNLRYAKSLGALERFNPVLHVLSRTIETWVSIQKEILLFILEQHSGVCICVYLCTDVSF